MILGVSSLVSPVFKVNQTHVQAVKRVQLWTALSVFLTLLVIVITLVLTVVKVWTIIWFLPQQTEVIALNVLRYQTVFSAINITQVPVWSVKTNILLTKPLSVSLVLQTVWTVSLIALALLVNQDGLFPKPIWIKVHAIYVKALAPPVMDNLGNV